MDARPFCNILYFYIQEEYTICQNILNIRAINKKENIIYIQNSTTIHTISYIYIEFSRNSKKNEYSYIQNNTVLYEYFLYIEYFVFFLYIEKTLYCVFPMAKLIQNSYLIARIPYRKRLFQGGYLIVDMVLSKACWMPTRNDSSRPICRFLLFVLCVSMRYLPLKFATKICQIANYFLQIFATIFCHYFLDICHYSIFSYYSIFLLIYIYSTNTYILNILSFYFCAPDSEYSFFFILRAGQFLLFYYYS